MSGRKISPEDIDALLRLLPRFEEPGRTFARWGGETTNPDGSHSLPFPVYEADVEEFFRLIATGVWVDQEYEPAEAGRILADGELVGRADPEPLRSRLTFCMRSERFGGGNWEACLRGGQVVALLRGLEAIRAGM